MCRVVYFFFFFKQKTAYEMRISDWSSDVVLFRSDPGTDGGHRGAKGRSRRRDLTARAGHFEGMRNMSEPIIICGDGRISRTGLEDRSRRAAGLFAARSEEHTSELQSLMRISYAVFCLKKKNYTYQSNSPSYTFTRNS